MSASNEESSFLDSISDGYCSSVSGDVDIEAESVDFTQMDQPQDNLTGALSATTTGSSKEEASGKAESPGEPIEEESQLAASADGTLPIVELCSGPEETNEKTRLNKELEGGRFDKLLNHELAKTKLNHRMERFRLDKEVELATITKEVKELEYGLERFRLDKQVELAKVANNALEMGHAMERIRLDKNVELLKLTDEGRSSAIDDEYSPLVISHRALVTQIASLTTLIIERIP